MAATVHDSGFVRAPTADCYRVLTHVADWPSWWPHTAVDTLRGDNRFVVRIGRLRRLELAVHAHAWRHDTGFRVAILQGDLAGGLEFWLEEGYGGTIVHHLATLAGGRQGEHRRYRRWSRRGLWSVKDHVQGLVLTR